MSPDDDLLRCAIHSVSGSWESFSAARQPSRNPLEQMMQSVLTVSMTAREVVGRKELPASMIRASIYEVSRCFARFATPDDTRPLIPPCESLFTAIGKAYDENLHSDFLGALLNPSRVGDLAYQLFDMLHAYPHQPSTSAAQPLFQRSYREMRLDQLNPALERQERGARRIDILVKRQDSILVIENKVWSQESSSQTADYFEAVKFRYECDRKLKFLFLSPEGIKADCSEFFAISYAGVYRMLSLLKGGQTWLPHVETLLTLYTREIGELFVRSKQKKLLAVIQLLAEAGYDV